MTSFAAIDAKCILDAGRTGIIMLSDRILTPRRHEWLILVPEAHWAKVAFENTFLQPGEEGTSRLLMPGLCQRG